MTSVFIFLGGFMVGYGVYLSVATYLAIYLDVHIPLPKIFWILGPIKMMLISGVMLFGGLALLRANGVDVSWFDATNEH